MREICLSGSEGGAGPKYPRPYPYQPADRPGLGRAVKRGRSGLGSADDAALSSPRTDRTD